MKLWAVLLLSPIAWLAASDQESPLAPVFGHVYAEDTGSLASGVTIVLRDRLTGFKRTIAMNKTDAIGEFHFPDLESATYSLSLEKAGYLPEYCDVRPGKEIIVRLRRAAVIEGRVMDSDGTPIPEALVEVVAESYTDGELALYSQKYTQTDDRGRYRIFGLEPGRYYIRALAEGYNTMFYPAASNLAGAQDVEIATGAELANIDFSLKPGARFHLRGRLIDGETGKPARAAFLRVEPADLVSAGFADASIRDGQFEVRSLAPGRFFLTFDWVTSTNAVTRTVRFPFDMKDADRSGVVLTAMPRITVSGRVRTGDRPVPDGLSVYLEPVANALRAKGGFRASSEVHDDGTFEITGVEAGEYRWRIHSSVPVAFFLPDQQIKIDGHGNIAGIGLDLDFSAGTLAGRAVSQTGEAISRVTVVLQSIDSGKRASDLYRHVHFVYYAGGDYTITGVIPGEYLLFAWRGDPNLIGDSEIFARARGRAQRVTILPGATIHQDATELR